MLSRHFQQISAVKGLNPLALRASTRYTATGTRLDDAVCGIRVTSFVNRAAIAGKSTGALEHYGIIARTVCELARESCRRSVNDSSGECRMVDRVRRSRNGQLAETRFIIVGLLA